jgi:hypothetical protein
VSRTKQYQDRIRAWRLEKNIKGSLAKTLLLKRQRLEAAGKHCDFFLHGKPVDWTAVEKSFRRRKVRSDDVDKHNDDAEQVVDGLVMLPHADITMDRYMDDNNISRALRKALYCQETDLRKILANRMCGELDIWSGCYELLDGAMTDLSAAVEHTVVRQNAPRAAILLRRAFLRATDAAVCVEDLGYWLLQYLFRTWSYRDYEKQLYSAHRSLMRHLANLLSKTHPQHASTAMFMALVEISNDTNFEEILDVLRRQKSAVTLAHLSGDRDHAFSSELPNAILVLGPDSEQMAQYEYAYHLARIEAFGMHDYRGREANIFAILIAVIARDWQNVEHLTRMRLSVLDEREDLEDIARTLLRLAHALHMMDKTDESVAELGNCADVLRSMSGTDCAAFFHSFCSNGFHVRLGD